MKDDEIIERFLKKEKEAFDELVLKYQRMVFNLCSRMLENYEEALDISQDIFIKVYDSLKNFRGEAKFSTYLYRITLNFCKNRLRTLRRQRKGAFSLDALVQTENGEIKRDVVDGNPGPREITNLKEREEIVHQAISSLEEDHREIILLREIEYLSYDEIAGILEIDLGTVKSRLSRARQALKEKLLELKML